MDKIGTVMQPIGCIGVCIDEIKVHTMMVPSMDGGSRGGGDQLEEV